jgi:aspartyl-tRNA(Asn)/glutamyl-tRNA(Gln) amidotransferase subunit A
MRTLHSLAADLEASRTTSRELVERCIANIEAEAGEGRRVFIKVHRERALEDADRHDRERRQGRPRSRFAGIPISIKDLFDLEGDVTTAGSLLLRDARPAKSTALAVSRLLDAGLVIIGRTNMTEFAFSGLGLNSHYGTPLNPFERALGRIPGGSSSGAAVSVADEMAFAALGTDTGGSCRIPAAMCGIVGFKPTAKRVSLNGALPLSPSLDSIGPLASCVEDCAILDSLLANEPLAPMQAAKLKGLRLAVPQSMVLDDTDEHVSSTFARALETLASNGAVIEEIALAELLDIPHLNRKGGLAAAECYAVHRDWIAQHASRYDPRVLNRIARGKEQDAADYIQLLNARKAFIERIGTTLREFDALVMPTVPFIAPTLASLADDAAYARTNMLALRNPSVFNFIDGCAISIPCHERGTAPVGLMIGGLNGSDQRVLGIAAALERVLPAE